MTTLAFPFRPAASGRSATVEDGGPDHVQQMLMLLILTVCGERVMRPDIGSAATQMLFRAGASAIATALQATLAATIAQQLGQYLQLQALKVDFDDASATLNISVDYFLLETLTPGNLTLQRSAG